MSQKVNTTKKVIKESKDKKVTKETKQVNKEQKNDEQIKSKKYEMPDDLKEVLKFNNGLEQLKNKVDSEINTLKQLRAELKKLETNYQQDIMKVWKSKKKRATNGDKTGFIKNKKLPLKLAQLIGVPEGTEMSMPKYTSKFYEQVLNKKNLLYKNDRRVFRANKELMDLFGLPESVNESTNYKDENGFNFSTLQKYFSKIMKEDEENNKQEEEDKPIEVKAKIVNKKKDSTKELKA